MKWYLKVMNNYANFNGRARREEFWMFQLINILIYVALTVVSFALMSVTESAMAFGLIYLYAFAILIPSLAVLVRRLHDIGKSGMFFFVSFIPIIGGIWLLVMEVTEGDKGGNMYGPDPKEEAF